MQEPTLYIMCGLPFSGKTVLTKELVSRLGFEYVNVDEIKFAHGFEWKEDSDITLKEWEKIFDESYQESLDYLHKGKSVVYDCANQDRASRDKLRKVAAEGNFPTKVIWLDISEEVVRERWSKNKTTKERFDLPERLFQSAIDTYQRPTEDENVIKFNLSTNLEEWIKANFHN